MPYGDQNSFSSSMARNTRRSHSPSKMVRNRRSSLAGRPHAGDVAGEIAAIVDEPHQAVAEAAERVERLLFERLHGQERNHADERSDAQRRARVIWHVRHVVEEAVLVLPEIVALPAVQAAAAHRVRDVQDVLPELLAACSGSRGRPTTQVFAVLAVSLKR
jgi:CRP-like cAMP-binding protein